MKVLMIFRLLDGFKNTYSLKVSLKEDDTLIYSLYEGWQPAGMPHAISNMQLETKLPVFMNTHTTKGLRLVLKNSINSGIYRVNHVDITVAEYKKKNKN